MMVLGPFGVKLRLDATEAGPPVGTVVRLKFEPPDGKSLMSINGIVWRVDPDGVVITFLNLRPHEFLRLKSLVDSLLAEPVESRQEPR